MKRIDRLLLEEIFGPWCFGVAMFSVLIFAGNYLFQISQFFVQGASPIKVVELTLLFLPGVIIKTFPMAILLAALLSFGRLSSDSEIIALRAAGVSMRQMMTPVAGFALAIAVAAFLLNELVVPPAALRALALRTEIATELKSSGMQELAASQSKDGKLSVLIAAGGFNLAARTLQKVTITAYDKSEKPSFTLTCPLLVYKGEKDWRIVGGGILNSEDGSVHVELKGDVWPPQVPEIKLTPQDLLRQDLKDLDALSLSQLREQIQQGRTDPHVSKKQLANLQYGFWNKFALPLAALVYGLLGAPLGIRNVRTGAATGFAVSVAIIFLYITLANLMNVYAMGGVIPAYVASFTPLLIGLVAAGVIIWRRNG